MKTRPSQFEATIAGYLSGLFSIICGLALTGIVYYFYGHDLTIWWLQNVAWRLR